MKKIVRPFFEVIKFLLSIIFLPVFIIIVMIIFGLGSILWNIFVTTILIILIYGLPTLLLTEISIWIMENSFLRRRIDFHDEKIKKRIKKTSFIISIIITAPITSYIIYELLIRDIGIWVFIKGLLWHGPLTRQIVSGM